MTRVPGSRTPKWVVLGVAIVALSSLTALLSAGASAERMQRGNLLATLQGDVSPLKLPRHHPVPVSLHLSGSLATTDESPLPRVSAMRFALAGRSGIEADGLPVCPVARLRNTRDREALDACSGALVGRGRLEVQARVPEQPPIPVNARLLIFNGRTRAGRTALLMHAYAEYPPVSVVIPFVLHRSDGYFGNQLIARGLASKPTISGFSMTLFRRFHDHGSRRSFLGGSCPLAPRLTSGLISLALLDYSLPAGRHIQVEIIRTCRARRRGPT